MKLFDPIRVPVNDPIFDRKGPNGEPSAQEPSVWYHQHDDTPHHGPVPPPGCFAATPTVAPTPVGPVPEHPAVSAPKEPPPCALVPCVEARRLAGFYKDRFIGARERNNALLAEIAELKAENRYLKQQLYGKKSETTSKADRIPGKDPSASPSTPKRSRGQQRHKPGPKRQLRTTLPAVEEFIDLPKDQQCCSKCHKPFQSFPGTEDSEIIEVETRIVRRVIRRLRYTPGCTCGVHPGIVCAPPAPRVIPKSHLGVSAWVEILMDKFFSYNPTNRLLADWRCQGLDLSQGTVTGGLQKLLKLFQPLYEKLKEHNRTQKRWNGDETRWPVYAKHEGKANNRWYLWLLDSPETTVYLLDPFRNHDVPEKALEKAQGIMVVDRYSSYKAMKQVKEGKILLAFCWAHVRRDFIDVARSWPDHQEWALGWVRRIGELYHCNNQRRQYAKGTQEFETKSKHLRELLGEMAKQRDKELADPRIHPARASPLNSMAEHWQGLTLFAEHDDVAMDNNQAERDLRGPVIARKNSRGSAARWAGDLAAVMYSLIQTLLKWRINPRKWQQAYLGAVANNGGNIPPDADEYLPWNMSEQRKKELQMKTTKRHESPPGSEVIPAEK